MPYNVDSPARRAIESRIVEFHGQPTPHEDELDVFADGYITAMMHDLNAEERESQEDHDQLNYDFRNIAPATIKKIVADCREFQRRALPFFDIPTRKAGIDFWLTRNGHGAGFWDGDWEHGKELTDIAHSFGQIDVYRGDDGLIYLGGAEGDWQLRQLKQHPNSVGGAIQNVSVRDDSRLEPESPSDGLEWPRNFGVDEE